MPACGFMSALIAESFSSLFRKTAASSVPTEAFPAHRFKKGNPYFRSLKSSITAANFAGLK